MSCLEVLKKHNDPRMVAKVLERVAQDKTATNSKKYLDRRRKKDVEKGELQDAEEESVRQRAREDEERIRQRERVRGAPLPGRKLAVKDNIKVGAVFRAAWKFLWAIHLLIDT